MEASLQLVAGLGNPGSKYAGTRHNIGFDILNQLADDYRVSFKKVSKWRAEVAQTPDRDLYLLKPLTYMNRSGDSIGPFARYYKVPLESLLVVYDDKDLPLGKLRLRARGSAGGHNGMKSLIQTFGSEDIPRLRIGIGSPLGDTIGHVLGRFSPEELQERENAVERAVQIINHIRDNGIQSAMNAYN